VCVFVCVCARARVRVYYIGCAMWTTQSAFALKIRALSSIWYRTFHPSIPSFPLNLFRPVCVWWWWWGGGLACFFFLHWMHLINVFMHVNAGGWVSVGVLAFFFSFW
jgi:hypothetical protein